MEPDHVVYVPASWYAFIPSDGSHGAQWFDLYEVAIFDWISDPVNPVVHITTRAGIKQKYQNKRAAHLLEQWALFRTKTPKRYVAEVQ